MAKGWAGVIDRASETLINDTERARRPYAFMCPKTNCYYAVSAESLEKAEELQATHNCPHIGGITHLGSTVTLTLLENLWVLADETYARFDSTELTETQLERLRGELNGLCKAICVFMPPLMHTPKEIGDEIRKRKNMRDAGETYETPGLGSRRYESALVVDARKPTVAQRAEKVLTEQERKAIKFAMESGMFTVANLAEMYSVTEAVIREVSS